MIEIKELITGKMHDPFTGEIYEGLISTINIDKAIYFLKKNGFKETYKVNDDEYFIVIEPKYPTDLQINYTSGNIHDIKISKALQLSNNLGYTPSFIKYYGNLHSSYKGEKYTGPTLRHIYHEYTPDEIWITFNKKFDIVINKKDLPDILYHLTELKHIDKIKRIGIKPTSKSKKKTHPDRAYFASTLDDIKILKLSPEFKNNDIIISIKTLEMPNNIIFYEDPDFEGKGVYTYNNISKEFIIDIFNINKLK